MRMPHVGVSGDDHWNADCILHTHCMCMADQRVTSGNRQRTPPECKRLQRDSQEESLRTLGIRHGRIGHVATSSVQKEAEGIAGPSLTGLPPCRLGSSGTHKFGWCNGGCTDENCILGGRVHCMKDLGICSTKRGFFWSSDHGPSSHVNTANGHNAPHKRPPNTLGLEENHILPWNTENGSVMADFGQPNRLWPNRVRLVFMCVWWCCVWCGGVVLVVCCCVVLCGVCVCVCCVVWCVCVCCVVWVLFTVSVWGCWFQGFVKETEKASFCSATDLWIVLATRGKRVCGGIRSNHAHGQQKRPSLCRIWDREFFFGRN